jgi:hypothetical protein
MSTRGSPTIRKAGSDPHGKSTQHPENKLQKNKQTSAVEENLVFSSIAQNYKSTER